MALSALNVSFRDVKYAVPFMVQMGIFTSVVQTVTASPVSMVLWASPWEIPSDLAVEVSKSP